MTANELESNSLDNVFQIRPLGNLLAIPEEEVVWFRQRCELGFGPFFSNSFFREDKNKVEHLFEYLSLKDLVTGLGATSKVFYTLTHANEDRWRAYGHERVL